MVQNALRHLSWPARPRVAAVIIRILGGYVLAGALAKIFWGAPSDLPAVLLNAIEWDPEGLFALVIALEMMTAGVALIAPRVGWPFLTCAFLAFLTVLVLQAGAGEASCGCFGSVAPVPLWMMLGLDALAVTLLLMTRPWQSMGALPLRRCGFAGAAIALAASIGYMAPSPRIADASLGHQRGTEESRAEPRSTEWRLPAELPRSVVLKPARWVGKPLQDTVLATFVDTSQFPGDTTLIIYYETCRHCAKHLGALAADPGDVDYVLLQVPTPPNSTHPVRVKNLPPAIHAKLPSGVRWSIQTPWEITVEDGIVTRATQPL